MSIKYLPVRKSKKSKKESGGEKTTTGRVHPGGG